VSSVAGVDLRNNLWAGTCFEVIRFFFVCVETNQIMHHCERRACPVHRQACTIVQIRE